jgi:diaminopimelate decarboxylase
VLDTADIRTRCRSYRTVLPDAEIAYAGKAFLCRGMARLVEEEGLSLDVCSAGEIAVARAGHAIPYRAGDAEFDLPGLAHRVHTALSLECARHAIPRPRLTVEPGRAIVGRAGVTRLPGGGGELQPRGAPSGGRGR